MKVYKILKTKNMEKIKYIRGNYNKKEEIKKAFLNLEAVNIKNYYFDRDSLLYYIKDKHINIIGFNNPLSQLLIEHGEEIKLPEKKELPKTWEEWVKTNPYIKEEFYISTLSTVEVQDNYGNRNKFCYNNLSSKEDAEGLLALIKLKRLKDCYNDGWEPDFNLCDDKFCICLLRDKISTHKTWHQHYFLTFRTQELRDTFLNNFRDLIEEAKMWL